MSRRAKRRARKEQARRKVLKDRCLVALNLRRDPLAHKPENSVWLLTEDGKAWAMEDFRRRASLYYEFQKSRAAGFLCSAL